MAMSMARGYAPAIGVVAGEASGDLLGAHLIEAVHARFPQARFVGVGGPRMQAAGMETLFPMEKLAVRGYVEVLRHYREILGIRRQLAARFLREPPACFIGIDAPDFNLGLEVKLKAAGIPTVHYVSPAIWAWRAGRIHKIRRAVSAMLVVFPFETRIYRQAGIPVTYVGHPLADALAEHPGRSATRLQMRLPPDVPIVALLPGSRVSEMEQMCDLFLAAARRIAEARRDAVFLLPVVSRETRVRAEAALQRLGHESVKVNILSGHAHEAMAAADVVLAASGTATLEAALLRRPMVIAYRMPRVSWWIMSLYRKIPHVGLPNILAGERLVPEFLQDDATPENLAGAVLEWMGDPVACVRLDARFSALLAELKQGAAERIVESLLPFLQDSRA
jgi:lipid-A-disaccharide synthase